MTVAEGNAAHCAALLREADPDRFIASLFLPATRRADVQALYAFDVETARIAGRVTQAPAGEIRLQWWSEAIGGLRPEEALAHPIAAAMGDVIARCHLPVPAFDNLLAARLRDLYDDPLATVSELEGYCGDTAAAMVRLACLTIAGGSDPGGADAAGHAGVALGVTHLLARAGHGRWAQFVPAELLARHGGRHADLAAGRETPAIAATLGELDALARRHLAAVRAVWPSIDPAIRPAFLPLALVEMRLRAAARVPLSGRQPALWRRQAMLWRAARRGRI
jgi:phytoene synthase